MASDDEYAKDIEYNFKKAFPDKTKTQGEIIELNNGVKYSRGESFEEVINQIANNRYYDDKINAILVRESSPDWMVLSGYEQLPILMTINHAKSIMGLNSGARHLHNVSEEILSSIPKLLENPIGGV